MRLLPLLLLPTLVLSSTLSLTPLKLSLTSSLGTTTSPPLPLTTLSPGDTLKLSFNVVDENGEGVQPHQSMIWWESGAGESWTQVVKVRKSGSGKIEIDFSRLPPSFSLLPSPLTPTLLISTFSHSPLSTPLGSFILSPSLTATPPPLTDEEKFYSLRCEIHWTVRDGEKKVFVGFSLLGVGLVLSAWVVVGLPLHIYLPLSSHPLTPSALLFILSILSIELLTLTYWIKLRLLQVLPWYAVLGLVGVWSGKKALGELKGRRERGEGKGKVE